MKKIKRIVIEDHNEIIYDVDSVCNFEMLDDGSCIYKYNGCWSRFEKKLGVYETREIVKIIENIPEIEKVNKKEKIYDYISIEIEYLDRTKKYIRTNNECYNNEYILGKIIELIDEVINGEE